ncbi:helix-turn-helix domain-containing protein [Caulobacter sp. RL271]|uniref:Helix-turn-helix domain-containing protein n=1 Tax=Caulobacter segnis TaxID=88688 RepID=A0ABY4ZR50_9CAUL|nr:helix-turn-helix domain-containing protein [Caulobacter segnis]USQ95282.1 helix-turn-helix domain-containing protein [Caulobacter segnis]
MLDVKDKAHVDGDDGASPSARSDQDAVRAHLAGRLRVLRHRAGLSQARLAKSIGVTPSQIHFYEHGQNAIGAATLFILARALGCGIADFYAGLDPMVDDGAPSARSLDAGLDQGATSLVVAYLSLSPEVQAGVLGLVDNLARLSERR